MPSLRYRPVTYLELYRGVPSPPVQGRSVGQFFVGQGLWDESATRVIPYDRWSVIPRMPHTGCYEFGDEIRVQKCEVGSGS